MPPAFPGEPRSCDLARPLPARARPHVAQRSLAEFAEDHCAQFGASISYHVLFSLFPPAIVLTAVFGIVVRAADVRADLVDTIAGALPLSPSGMATVRRLLRGATGGLSTFGLIGVVGLIYSASGIMASIRTAVSTAFDVSEPRPFLEGKLIDVGLIAVRRSRPRSRWARRSRSASSRTSRTPTPGST